MEPEPTSRRDWLSVPFSPWPIISNGPRLNRRLAVRDADNHCSNGKSERGLDSADPSPVGERSARASGKSGGTRSDRSETSGGAVAVAVRGVMEL
jgi:hypothetical protein